MDTSLSPKASGADLESVKAFCQVLLTTTAHERKFPGGPEIHTHSLTKLPPSYFFMAKMDGKTALVECSPGEPHRQFTGAMIELPTGKMAVYEKTRKNTEALRNLFPFTRPISLRDRPATFGCGDRLGIATPAHIKALRGYQVTPNLAQQSTRELKFTNRTFSDVLGDVSWAVFQENYQGGFGADADHLKTREEVQTAIDAGMTFITIDLSDAIDNLSTGMSADQIASRYRALPSETRLHYERGYLNKGYTLEGLNKRKVTLSLNDETLVRIVLTYHAAVSRAIAVHQEFIKPNGLDYEISVDETTRPTGPEAHFVVANELAEAGVDVTSLAPRFCGEFQKGVDYIGDLAAFETDLAAHAAIADRFGHKLSIHSGSDKFSIYPLIGQYTRGRFHVKTSGTWSLEAMRLVAVKNPSLYREFHAYCLRNYVKIKALYHITENVANIPDLSTLSDDALPALLDNDDLRRVMHICYGLALDEKDSSGGGRFRSQLYELWAREESAHDKQVAEQLWKHFDMLGIPRSRPRE